MELTQFNTHYELSINHIDDKPAIISKKWILDFVKTINSLENDMPLHILAPSGIAGANISEMRDMTKKEAKKFAELGNEMIKSLLYYKPLVIGFFDKYLLGGGLEFSLACDIVLSTVNCKIGFPESTLGIIPGFFGIDLVHYKNNPKLEELLYTGIIIKAEETKNNPFFTNLISSWEEQMIRKANYIDQYKNVTNESLTKIKDRNLELKKYNTFEQSAKEFSEMFEQREQIERMEKFLSRKKL